MPPHLITLQYIFYFLLRFFVSAAASGFLQLCPEMLICQNLPSLALNVLVVLAGTTLLGKLFHIFSILLEKVNYFVYPTTTVCYNCT